MYFNLRILLYIALVTTFVNAGILPINLPAYNCQEGQRFIDGKCTTLLRQNQEYDNSVTLSPNNIVTVRPNCPTGQEWINGQCRDVWPRIDSVNNKCADGKWAVNGRCVNALEFILLAIKFKIPNNIIVGPDNCPVGQQLVNGVCRDIWSKSPVNVVNHNEILDQQSSVHNIITVPTQCPAGYRPDANGICREIWA